MSSVLNQNIGTPTPNNVKPVNPDMLGTTTPTPAHAATYQELSSTDNVFALPPKPFGTTIPKLAHAHPKLTVTTVFPAQLPEFGTTPTTNVSAQPLKLNGMDKNVSAPLEDMDLTVSNAHHQDTGTMPPTNVFATLPSSGTARTVSALNLGSYGKDNAPSAPKDSNGSITDVKNATALGKNWKLSAQNFERNIRSFIHLSSKFLKHQSTDLII